MFRCSFNCDSFLAAAETAIEETTQAEQHAQELIAKREAFVGLHAMSSGRLSFKESKKLCRRPRRSYSSCRATSRKRCRSGDILSALYVKLDILPELS